jgi:hypothetical protein
MIDFSFIIGAASNALRGGRSPMASKEFNKALNALIWGALIAAYSGDLPLAMWSVLAMWVGTRPGWGDYIGALYGYRIDNLKENRVIDLPIRFLLIKPKMWGAAGLLLRGLVWGAALSIPFFCYGYFSVAIWLIILSLTMPLAYAASAKWAKNAGITDWTGPAWSLGEIFYGAALWSPLGGL